MDPTTDESVMFEVHAPEAPETPVVVEVPHAGTWVPSAYREPLVAPERALARDADLYVDELYVDAPLEGATLLVARTSRYVLDLNRSEDDWDEAAVEMRPGSSPPRLSGSMPRGLVWRLTTDGEAALSRPLTRAELDARVRDLHRPYHATLQRLLDEKKARFGFAVLLAAHSMPSSAVRPRAGSALPTARATDERADVVPGTQGRTTAKDAFIDLVDRHSREAGLSVRHDDPYRGGYSTRFYGRPRDGYHAVQVELARRLYMDEITLARSDRFERTRSFCRTLVARLGTCRP